ncbi:MAG TPA: hypothetical protein DEQ32_05695 [Gammaproteobacteria bacterium]|nr:hypothetical protein [Gammaproteobacteria bacterium]|tara:strand:+ start:1655 stop:2296 length:642 start_codon:yes stop_codon:yes gene_type:complete
MIRFFASLSLLHWIALLIGAIMFVLAFTPPFQIPTAIIKTTSSSKPGKAEALQSTQKTLPNSRTDISNHLLQETAVARVTQQYKKDPLEGTEKESEKDSSWITRSISEENDFASPEKQELARFGRATFTDGTTYEGEFLAGKPDGEGRLSWPNGQFYQGLWEEGFQHGAGVLTYANGDWVSGVFEKGRLHGLGRCSTAGIQTACTFFEGERLN